MQSENFNLCLLEFLNLIVQMEQEIIDEVKTYELILFQSSSANVAGNE